MPRPIGRARRLHAGLILPSYPVILRIYTDKPRVGATAIAHRGLVRHVSPNIVWAEDMPVMDLLGAITIRGWYAMVWD